MTFSKQVERINPQHINPKDRFSLISKESLREDMAITDFIRACQPANIVDTTDITQRARDAIDSITDSQSKTKQSQFMEEQRESVIKAYESEEQRLFDDQSPLRMALTDDDQY